MTSKVMKKTLEGFGCISSLIGIGLFGYALYQCEYSIAQRKTGTFDLRDIVSGVQHACQINYARYNEAMVNDWAITEVHPNGDQTIYTDEEIQAKANYWGAHFRNIDFILSSNKELIPYEGIATCSKFVEKYNSNNSNLKLLAGDVCQ